MFWCQWQARRGLYHSLHLWWDLGKRLRNCLLNFALTAARLSVKSVLLCKALLLVSRHPSIQEISLKDQTMTKHLLASPSLMLQKPKPQVCSRALWVEEGETSSAFFLRLEKQHHASKMVDLLQLDNGQFISDTPDLLQAWEGFYSSLFTSIPTDEDIQYSFLDSLERVLSPKLLRRLADH
jgi:hypothetical protein